MEMQTVLSKIEEQFEKQTTRIAENIAKNLTITIDEKLQPILEENQELKKEITALKIKLQNMERALRRNNIILHGLEETENSPAELLELVLENFNYACGKADIECWNKWEISNIRRLGKPIPNKIRPINITVTLLWRKAEILKIKKDLPKNVCITGDFSKDVLNKRKELKIQQKEEIKKGNQAYIRYDRLIIVEKTKQSLNRDPTKIIKTK